MIEVFEAFAGYGSQSMGLRDAGVQHKQVGFCEINPYAECAYQALHPGVMNYGDITKVNPEDLPDFNLFTFSFPCQDISVSGKQRGLAEGSGTRSGLLWECRKIIKTKKPKYLLMENVKNLVGKKFKAYFDDWLSELEDMGYKNYWKVMNARKHGIPQNRERVFCVSILGGDRFEFPEEDELQLHLVDMLDDNVDEKYFLKGDVVNEFIMRGENLKHQEISNCITPGQCRVPSIPEFNDKSRKQLVQIPPTAYAIAQRGRPVNNPTSGISGQETKQRLETDYNEFSNCLTTVGKDSMCLDTHYRIRRLTPKECFRLMDVKDEDYKLIRQALIDKFYNGKDRANSQLYKLAGNSIVVRCMTKIFRNLFKDHIK